MKITLFALLILSIVSSSLAVYFYTRQQMASSSVVNTLMPAPQKASAVSLPADAVKISECIPFEGEHYVQPSKLPYGPFYSAYKGKVISVEYMFTPDKIPGEAAAKMTPQQADALIKKNHLSLADLVIAHDFEFDLMNLQYKSFGIEWSSPHSGLPLPHYDIHLFLVDDSESKQICPDSKLENVYSSEVMDNIDKYKIPFPSAGAGLNNK